LETQSLGVKGTDVGISSKATLLNKAWRPRLARRFSLSLWSAKTK